MKTFREMIEDVRRDMNLDFNITNPYISEADVKRFINEGQEEVARRLQKIKEDYFVTVFDVPFETGINEYALPPDIYAHKIRKVAFIENEVFTTIKKLTFQDYIRYSSPIVATGSYPIGYYILEKPIAGQGNKLGTSTKLILLPPGGLINVRGLQVYYIRIITPMVMDSDTPDIPESTPTLEAYARRKVALYDPTRSSESFVEEWNIFMKNLLESYTDRTPEEGGDLLQIDAEDLEAARGFAEDL